MRAREGPNTCWELQLGPTMESPGPRQATARTPGPQPCSVDTTPPVPSVDRWALLRDQRGWASGRVRGSSPGSQAQGWKQEGVTQQPSPRSQRR